jgi:choline dehydrogenase
MDSQNKTTNPVLLSNYDYIIIGAGSAGCVIARRLIDGTDASVLVLEAGGPNVSIETISNPTRWVENMGSVYDHLYNFAPSPATNNRIIPIPRGKVLGGSGSINGLVWTRGHRADYDDWAAAGNEGWDYESVLPLFKKIEDWEGGETDFHGAGGPIGVGHARDLHLSSVALIEACRTYGMPILEDANGPEPEGASPMSLNVKNGVRQSPTEYLKPVMGSDRLTVLTHAKVLKLNLNGSHCTGLELNWEGAVHTLTAHKEVILSAGAIDSPRVLMLSGIGEADELKQLGIDPLVDLPGVGKNLQDHILLAGMCYETHEPLGSPNNNLCGSQAYWKSNQGLAVPDLMFLPIHAPFLSAEIVQQYGIPENHFCLVPGLVKPQSRGYVKMKTARHDGPLEIQPNYLGETADLEALISGVEIGLELAAQPAFKNIIKRLNSPTSLNNREEIVAFVRDATSSYYHPVGTCAMGIGANAVVDSKLKVYGVTGLRVADASVMPTISSANTNATTMMIGEFAAKSIIESI